MGEFIAIEGGDGSGKGTQAELLRAYVGTELGLRVMKLSFPRYGEASAYYVERYLNGDYGEADAVHAELGTLPYALDRFAAKNDIEEYLKERGSLVIADRYMASNLAHQGAKISDPTERRTFYERTMLTEYEILDIPRPSKNIVLLVPTSIAQANVDKKAARSYTTAKRDIHEADANHLERAKRNYEELCQLYPDEFTGIDCVDENGKQRTIEDIQQDIRKILHI